MVRKLRIAVSVFFAVVTVALCVVWARSYWRTDSCRRVTEGNHVTSMWSSQGSLRFTNSNWSVPYVVRTGWTFEFLPLPTQIHGEPRFLLESSPGIFRAYIPHWFATLVAASIITLPWLVKPQSFSLRALLIATTLVAVVLGLGVWLAR